MSAQAPIEAWQAAGFLEGLAHRLDGWAEASVKYGYSTHQVDDNRRAADDCRRMAANLKKALGPVPKGEVF